MKAAPGINIASTPDEEQSRLLQEISGQIKKHAFYLKRAMVRLCPQVYT